jgi:cyclophilin family peptidyl-prolyl cis-trans isomerase
METGDEVSVIKCGTTTGPIVMEMHREWSPKGYDKAVALFEKGYYDHTHFFRVVPHYLVQFGITYSEDQELKNFGNQDIMDDPQLDPIIPFEPGTISFAGSGPNSRSSHLFISYDYSTSLGTELWETPVGKVIDGMDNAVQFYSYGDMPPWGKGPEQGLIYDGPSYINDNFPLTDKFLTCIVKRQGKADQRDPTGIKGRKIAMNPMHQIVMKAKEFDQTALLCAGAAIILLIISICGIGGRQKATGKKAS